MNTSKSIFQETKPIFCQGPLLISFSEYIGAQLTTKGPQVCGSTKTFNIELYDESTKSQSLYLSSNRKFFPP